MQPTVTLNHLIAEAKAYLVRSNYANSTVARYHCVWNGLSGFYSEHGLVAYSYPICLDAIVKRYNIRDLNHLSSSQRFQVRCLKMLDSIANNIPVSRCYRDSATHLAEPGFQRILEEYKTSLDLNPKTICSKETQLIRFLNYVSSNGYHDIVQLDEKIIQAYVASLRPAYAWSTCTWVLFTLRQFFQFLHDRGYSARPLQELYPVIKSNKRRTLPSVYSREEIARILDAIDRDDTTGKRDYLVLLLSIQLGIRAGDIRLMTIDSFNWDKNTIEFIQEKTENPIQLPLTDEIRYALIDYLKNARPIVDSPFVFIRLKAPYTSYCSTNVFYYVISRYMEAAEIDCDAKHRGLHSMRHSLASSLLENNTPYPIITGILGHKNTSTTQGYLSIDIEQLRSVALEVPCEE